MMYFVFIKFCKYLKVMFIIHLSFFLNYEYSDRTIKSIFHFVDLAGSERISSKIYESINNLNNHNTFNLEIKDSNSVNKSLLNLTHVIKQLVD